MSDFKFKFKTHANKSGRSAVCSDGRKFSVISGNFGLAVNFKNRSAAPYLVKMDIASADRFLVFRGDPSSDYCRITGIPAWTTAFGAAFSKWSASPCRAPFVTVVVTAF
ncbi:hypothetical protein AVEN_50808-1 [Araneus ventricosus]|uniref:Uncharacterized protein n=1 Tax=Araneus ventricosus TaxID=182803 RepID=A0A4Y2ITY8_ARAVE|nr:hypothetical protein AVEN_50808-1 [Araneus ventricosus]